MTSSSDTELLNQRRVSVHGLPSNCQSSELRSLFSRCGGITAVHVTRHGHGFVTFDDGESANAALSFSGITLRENRLTVKLSQYHDNLMLPVIGAKREIYFPRPFGGRGGQTSGGSSSSYRSSSSNNGGSSSRPRNGTASGPNASSSRSSRSGGPSHRPSLLSLVKVIKVQSDEDFIEVGSMDEKISQLFLALLSFDRFPEISKKIFSYLDIVSLYRCRLVCRLWSKNIWHFVLDSVTATRKRRESWCSNHCSIYPLTPATQMIQPEENPEFRYRNVLSVKADEKSILLALDNGNVEVYDRFTLKLSFILAGEYSISPVGLDFNASFILVNYTCGFVNRFRTPMPSSWWSIFCRESGKLLKVIERENSRFYEDVRLGEDDLLHLVTKNSIYFIDFGGKELLDVVDEDGSSTKRSSRNVCPNLLTHQVVSIHVGCDNNDADSLEVVDIDTNRISGVIKRSTFSEILLCVWRKPSRDEILAPVKSRACQKIDFMTGLETAFPILENYTSPDFDPSKCSCISMQLRYPLSLVLLSNNRGLFEVLNSCRPYVLFTIIDVANETTLRVLTLDCTWMLKMSDMLVPYDCDTCVLTAKFNNDFLVAGFGSSSDIKDGGIALWSLEELLNDECCREDVKVFTLPSPVYHWGGWDGHTGGVTDIHLDSWGMIAVNACKHQVTTRCIERFDEARKDNVLIYDFWSQGKDLRREQR